MVNALGRNARARARLAYGQTRQMYTTAVVGGLCTILLVLVMWLINIAGGKEVNYIFLFPGLAVIAIWAFSPKRILIAMGAGAIVQGLSDEDITQGAVTGVKTLYQGTLGVMLWFAITAGMLSVLSFKESPASFFSIAAMLFILAITFVSIPSKFLRVVVAGVAVAVIVYHGWQITPKELKEKMESVAKSATSSPAKEVTSLPSVNRKVFTVSETEWSTPTRVTKGFCFSAWVDKHGLPKHKTQVSTFENPDDWKDVERAAGIPIAWVRHGSKGPGKTEVTEEIRRDGDCS